METVEILITEGKSLREISKGLVRVFINNDYHYGFWVIEEIVYNRLSSEQQAEYFVCNKFNISKDAANFIIEYGQSPYKKNFIE